MLIKINDEYAIESDPNCWAISKWEKNKTKGDGYIQFLWYSTFEGAVQGLAQRLVRLSNAQSLEEAIIDAGRVKETIRKALEPSYKIEEL
jgi:hypothetical protein